MGLFKWLERRSFVKGYDIGASLLLLGHPIDTLESEARMQMRRIRFAQYRPQVFPAFTNGVLTAIAHYKIRLNQARIEAINDYVLNKQGVGR